MTTGPGARPAVGSGAPPRSVTLAFFLWLAALGLALVNAIVAIAFPPGVEEWSAYFASLGLPSAGAEARAAADAGVTTSVLTLALTVVFAGLFAFLGVKMRDGANWARITNAVLAGLSVLGGLGTLAFSVAFPVPQPGGVPGTILQVVQLIVIVGFLWFLVQRPSNEWFRAHQAR